MNRRGITIGAAVLAVVLSACSSRSSAPAGGQTFGSAPVGRPSIGARPAKTPPSNPSAKHHRQHHRQKPSHQGGAGGGDEGVLVTRVVDGDTIEVRLHGRTTDIRLIGMDTPETVAPGQPVGCYGEQASHYTSHHLSGRQVHLQYDVERKDRYGRTLAYVYLGGHMFNMTLVKKGYATAYPYPPNTRYESRFASLERQAREHHRGLWGACHSIPN